MRRSVLLGRLSLAVILVAGVSANGRDERLIEAAKKDDLAAVQDLLKQRVDANLRSADGSTALHWAAHNDDSALVEELVKNGALVNVATELGVTPLWEASANGNTTVIGSLLRAGADPNMAPPTGGTALMIASRQGNMESVKLLIAHGANVNATESSRGQNALMWAAAERRPDLIRLLVEAHADVDARSTVTSEYVRLCCSKYNGDPGTALDFKEGAFTALLFAARQGEPESINILLDAGANIEAKSASGTTPLVMAATQTGQRPVTMLLLERGADPNNDDAGYTALHAAVLQHDMELVKALLAHGAKPNTRLKKATPAKRYSTEQVAFDSELVGATPLLMASLQSHVALMRTLADAGADISVPLLDGTTPLMVATRGETGRGADRLPEPVHMAAASLAMQLGADVNAVDLAGNTALHLAAKKRFDTIVQILVDAGAGVNVKNKSGNTPLVEAMTPSKLPDGAFNDGDVAVKKRFDAKVSTAELLKKLGAHE